MMTPGRGQQGQEVTGTEANIPPPPPLCVLCDMRDVMEEEKNTERGES